ncbi:MAG: c-type cytochrome [Aureibaculum sp.]|nr:c-type cytochrome [Aureibaculum sp.]
MRLNIIIISLLSFTLISCNHSKEVTVYKTEPIAINETKIEQTESYQLFKNNCYTCHSVTSKSHDEIIAPPMAAIKRRYQMSTETRNDFIEAIVKWAKDPKEENALMYGAVQQFKVMPKQAFYEEDLLKIATYIYDNDIEQPDWFGAHFKEQHGGKGMGKRRMRGM